MRAVGLPKSILVLVRNRAHQTDSLPKYLVFSRYPVKNVKRDDLRIKVIDLGEGLPPVILTMSLSIKIP